MSSIVSSFFLLNKNAIILNEADYVYLTDEKISSLATIIQEHSPKSDAVASNGHQEKFNKGGKLALADNSSDKLVAIPFKDITLESKGPNKSLKKLILLFIFAILAFVFFISLLIVLFSNDPKKIDFAIDSTKSLIFFFIGTATTLLATF